ncbi:MAG: fumarylacetoacetate hydrolase family protein [Methanobacteriaceae archaeon]|nr:fumarylacetoacetate hydrolase family protein [Methanobacteriaceae archaeon]
MKLVRFQTEAKEKIGLINDDIVQEISLSFLDALNSDDLSNFAEKSYKLNQIQIKPPTYPSKIICVGLNYQDHAQELNMEIPEEPVIFMKPPTSVIGHLDNIIYPSSSIQVDYEVELAVIISKKAKNIKKTDFNEFIGGYTILNDVTARDLQSKDIQWTRAKSFDTFCPIGPCIETDLDPNNLKISLKLNGKLKQKSNTRNMIFSIGKLLEFISNIMTLNPGDIIATGTPPGVGPMNRGDVVQANIEDIGVLENNIK